MTPTMFGDAFIEHARAVLAELRRVNEHHGPGGRRGRHGDDRHAPGGLERPAPRAIAALKKDRPGITVIVQEATFDAQVPASSTARST